MDLSNIALTTLINGVYLDIFSEIDDKVNESKKLVNWQEKKH